MVARIGRGGLLRSERAWRVASLLLVVISWELVGRQNPVFMSYPSAVVLAAWEVLFVDPELIRAFRVTLWGFAVGYVSAVLVGSALGFLMAQFRLADVALGPYVRAFYTLPRIALIPLLILFAGIGFGLRVSIVFLSAVFSIVIIVRDGGVEVGQEHRDVAKMFDATQWQEWRTAILPGSLPYLFSALRVGAQRALIGVIVAETLAALTGTGKVIADYGKYYQTDKLLVPVILIGLFSIGLTALLNRVESKALPYKRRAGVA